MQTKMIHKYTTSSIQMVKTYMVAEWSLIQMVPIKYYALKRVYLYLEVCLQFNQYHSIHDHDLNTGK